MPIFRRKILTLIWLAGGLLSEATGAEKPSSPAAKGAMPPPTVSFIVTEATTIPIIYEYIGFTESSKTVEIRARIQGFLDSRLFKEGERVKEGDLLYKIDPRSFQADVEVASAQVEQAEANLRLTESEWQRLKQLRKTGTASQSELDQAQMAYDSARAALSLAKANLSKSRLSLSYTEIRSPLTGLISKTIKEVGSLVDENTNSLLARVYKIDPIYVTLSVSERDYLERKQEAAQGHIFLPKGIQPYFQVVLQDGSILPQEGKLNFENPTFNQEAGTLPYRAEFPNPDMALKPGQYVKGRMLGWVRPNTIVVPQRAVNQIPTGAFLLVIGEKNVTEFRKVTLGPWFGDQWIITDGLKPGEKVLVDGILKAQAGMTVSPVPYQEPTTNPPPKQG